MKLGRQLRVSVSALARHKLRSSLSSLGIVFGVGALVAMLSVAEGAKRQILDQIARLGTDNLILRPIDLTEAQRRGARSLRPTGLTRDDLALLAATVPGVEAAAPLAEVSAAVIDTATETPPEVVATTRAYFEAKGLEPRLGRLVCDADVAARSLVCVLGAEVARALGTRGRPGSLVRIESTVFEVVGVLVERGLGASTRDAGPDQSRTGGAAPGASALAARDVDRTVFLPLGSEAALGPDHGGAALAEISLRMRDTDHVGSGADVVRRTLGLAHGGVEDYQLIVPTELIRQAHGTQRIFNLVLGAVAAISLLVGGVGILNILLASVSERTREIGIRRSVGASRAQILGHFLTESTVLTAAGGLLGVAAGVGGAVAISELAGWSTIVTPWGIALSLSMAIAVGLGAGLYPALRAAYLDPIEALRHR